MQAQLASFGSEVFAIFVMLGILSALIIIHECGHFSVARLFGFQTPIFGFGLPFGPHWVIGKKWGTEFRVHACLLGGFVAIPELGDESNTEAFGIELQPFRKFPIWQRALVAFAGVGFNMIFAYLIMLVMIITLGMPFSPTMVMDLDKNNPIASTAGVKEGDEIQKVDNQEVDNTDTLIKYLGQHKEQTVHLSIVRDGKPLTIDVAPNSDGRVGLILSGGPTTYRKVSGGPVYFASTAFTQLCDKTGIMVQSIGELFKGMMPGHKVAKGQRKLGIGDMHGVLAIIKIGADIAKQDWTQLLMFSILISMDLALVNLLPWPALDGWHLATMTVEGIRGRPMGERAQGELVKWGFITLLFLMGVIMVNDVTALIQGKLDLKTKADKATSKTKGGDDSSGSKLEQKDEDSSGSKLEQKGEDSSGSKLDQKSETQPDSQSDAKSDAKSESNSTETK